MNRQELEQRRAALMREAGALRQPDGTFANDDARRSFDAKMAEVGEIDIKLRDGRSEFLVERNPLDPGAPTNRPRITPAEETTPEPNDLDRAAEVERERINGILSAGEAARIPMKKLREYIDGKVPLVRAQSLIFEEIRSRGSEQVETRAQVSSTVQFGEDPMVHARAGIENALLHRAASGIRRSDNTPVFELSEEGKKYRGLTVLETAGVYLRARGLRTTDMSKDEIARMALGLDERSGVGYHTTSDFPLLLADVANKILRAAYAEAPQTYAPITRRMSVTDFKTVYMNQLGDAPALQEVNEHGEFTHGTISEARESTALKTYGRIFAITRRALINDDTDAFSRVPMMFGRKARTLEADLAWEQITSNPTMGDSNPLFDATNHGNYEAAAGGPITVTTLGVGRAALRTQTGLDGERLNLTARYLIVPTGQETLAEQFVTVITPNLAGSVNPFQGRLTVIAEPRLDTQPGAWYLAASPDQIDIIVLLNLEGQEGPQVDRRIGFEIDGLELKCRLDTAAKVVDWRGLYKNDGTS